MFSLFYCSILRSSDLTNNPDGNKSIELLLERTKNLQQNDARVKTPVQESEGKSTIENLSTVSIVMLTCEPDRLKAVARARLLHFFLINETCKLLLLVREKKEHT